MNGGPFEIDSEHKSVLRKSDLAGNGHTLIEATD
jgi:hypothetical protein